MPINKLANTRKSKTNSIPKLDLALTFFSHTHETTKESCQATCHCTCCAFSLSFCRATCLSQARAYMHIVLQSLCKFQLKQKNENKLIHVHMHLHMLQMHLSSILQNDASPEINASLQKHHHAKRFEIKCSLEVVVVEQIHHARQNKFQTISTNIILTFNVHKHILQKGCSPRKRSQPSMKLVQT